MTDETTPAGGKPVAKPTFVFPATSEKSFLALASVLENTGVGAYNGAAPSLKSKQVLASAGSIVQVEARHAAAIDLLIGKSPTPNEGFDKPLSKAAVLGAVGTAAAAFALSIPEHQIDVDAGEHHERLPTGHEQLAAHAKEDLLVGFHVLRREVPVTHGDAGVVVGSRLRGGAAGRERRCE